jgi:hypothetical protein
MDCQLKQTALPCRLSGEHVRRHYIRPCADRPLPDVPRCVEVGVGLVATAGLQDERAFSSCRIFLHLETLDQITISAKALVSSLSTRLDDLVVEFVVADGLSLYRTIAVHVINLKCVNAVTIAAFHAAPAQDSNSRCFQTKPQRSIWLDLLGEIGVPILMLTTAAFFVVRRGVGLSPEFGRFQYPGLMFPIVDLVTTQGRGGFAHLATMRYFRLNRKGNRRMQALSSAANAVRPAIPPMPEGTGFSRRTL